MSNANEEFAARRLADALQKLSYLSGYSHPADFDESLSVSWSRGSATPGYKEMAKAISQIVASQWSALRDQAIKQVQQAVDEARADLRSAQGKSGD
jgi:hypothetical protein